MSSLKVSSDLSELDLNLTPDDPIEFVEVFSEQGVQLLFFSIDPAGPRTRAMGVDRTERRKIPRSLFPRMRMARAFTWSTKILCRKKPCNAGRCRTRTLCPHPFLLFLMLRRLLRERYAEVSLVDQSVRRTFATRGWKTIGGKGNRDAVE